MLFNTWDLELIQVQGHWTLGPMLGAPPNSKNCEEAFMKPDVDASKQSPITPSGNETQTVSRGLAKTNRFKCMEQS